MKTISEEDISLLRHLVCDLNFAWHEARSGRFNTLYPLMRAAEDKVLSILANVDKNNPTKN